MQVKCKVCKEYFETMTNSKICDNCKLEISRMSKVFTYKERVKMLKERYKNRKKKKLSIEDKFLLFYCSKCLWCRKVDVSKRKIYCSLPKCKRFIEEK